MKEVILKEKLDAKIEFNYTEFRAECLKFSEKYKGLVVTDENLIDMHKTLREAKSIPINLEKFRKKVKSEYSIPLKRFEEKIKSLSEEFNANIQNLGQQLESYENKRRELLKNKISNAMRNLELEFKIKPEYYNFVYKDFYFNKTQTWKGIEEDLRLETKKIIDQQNMDMQIKQIQTEKENLIWSLLELKNKDLTNHIKIHEASHLICNEVLISEIPAKIEEIFLKKQAEEKALIEKLEEKKQAEIEAEKEKEIEIERSKTIVQEKAEVVDAKNTILLKFLDKINYLQAIHNNYLNAKKENNQNLIYDIEHKMKKIIILMGTVRSNE